jgi:hypothetical protein
MKSPIVKVLVLIVSLGLAGGYVWNTTRGKDGDANSPADKRTSQGDGKVQNEPEVTVSDEEVAYFRKVLMSSSESGRSMSDENIREMLENKKRSERSIVEVPADTQILLAPSSKSAVGLLNPGDIDKFFDAGQIAPVETQEDK